MAAVKKFETDLIGEISAYTADTQHFETDDFNTEVEDVLVNSVSIDSIQVTGIENGRG